MRQHIYSLKRLLTGSMTGQLLDVMLVNVCCNRQAPHEMTA